MMNFTDGQLITLTYTSILMLILPGCAELVYEWVQSKKSTGITPEFKIKPISEPSEDHSRAA